jgi:pyruvate formate lyase activating enzyme
MLIGGLEKLTLIDFPGEVAAIVFTQGCNFRCQFCYNPMLVWPEKQGKLKYRKDHRLLGEDDLFAFLRERRGKLDGVVITGGEPTLHADLPEFIARIKALGFKVKLDTNGTNPEMLQNIVETHNYASLPLVDYIAMDMKAPLDKYLKVVGLENINPVKSGEAGTLPAAELLNRVRKSVKMIMESGIPYEFRTTLSPDLHDKGDIAKMGELLRGADKWYLQFLKTDTDLVNREFEGKEGFTEAERREMAEIGRQYVKICEVRG